MKTTTMGGFVVVVLATVAAAQAKDREWQGAWTLEGTRASRVVQASGPGRISVGLEVSGQPVTCSGDEGDTRLVLEGTLARSVGVVGALEQREGATGPGRVRLDLQLVDMDPETASERATVRVSVDGRTLREETWSRPGHAGLEIVAVTPRADWSPRRGGPLQVRVIVRGRPQRVELVIDLPAKERSSERAAFYRMRGALKGSTLCTLAGPELPVGSTRSRGTAVTGRAITASRCTGATSCAPTRPSGARTRSAVARSARPRSRSA